MTLDVKLPRWLAWILAVLFIVNLIEGIVCQAINAKANLYYMETGGTSPPPPYPGQPAMQKTEREKRKDDAEGRKKVLRPRK